MLLMHKLCYHAKAQEQSFFLVKLNEAGKAWARRFGKLKRIQGQAGGGQAP